MTYSKFISPNLFKKFFCGIFVHFSASVQVGFLARPATVVAELNGSTETGFGESLPIRKQTKLSLCNFSGRKGKGASTWISD